MQVITNSKINITDYPIALAQLVKKDLTISNPNLQRAETMGFSTYDIDPHIKIYEENHGTIRLPRGYGKMFNCHLRNLKLKSDLCEDNRLELEKVNFISKITLRDYQKKAVNDLLHYNIGGLCSPCGSGKTIMMLEVAARVNQPTLWITHTRELLEQTKERATQFLNLLPEEIGIIAGGKVNIKPKLTIALIQTLCKQDIKLIDKYFGCVIIDEAHHMAADSFFNCVNNLSAKYRYWATATPNREDGLTLMVTMSGGPIQAKINRDCIPTITPILKVIKTNFNYPSENYTKLLTKMEHDDYRNNLIVETIIRECQGNYSIVITQRTGHAEQLKILLQEKLTNKKIEVLHGKLPKKIRAKIMESAKNKKLDILICTQLAREGLDITHLNRLFLVMPKSSINATIQEVGRIQRPCEYKTDAIVYDFWDYKQSLLKKQFWKRKQAYNRLGFGFKF